MAQDGNKINGFMISGLLSPKTGQVSEPADLLRIDLVAHFRTADDDVDRYRQPRPGDQFIPAKGAVGLRDHQHHPAEQGPHVSPRPAGSRRRRP